MHFDKLLTGDDDLTNWGVKFEVEKGANHNVNKLSKQTITEFPDILGDIIKAKLAYRSPPPVFEIIITIFHLKTISMNVHITAFMTS